jgi:hypothetical protein
MVIIMVKEGLIGKMGIVITVLEIMYMVKCKAKDIFVLKMVIDMRENFKMINFMVTELLIGKMVINMREIGHMIRRKEKESNLFKMVMNMRANFIMIIFMVTELFNGNGKLSL